MAKKIPIKLQAMALFMEGSNQEFATGDITLPSLTPTTDNLSGPGVLGVIDLPSLGHYDSLVIGITWRTIDQDAFRLVGSDLKALEIRGVFREFNNEKTVVGKQVIKIVVRGFSKGIDLGTLSPNAASDTTTSIEATYLKIFINGENVFELDKLNSICRINGVDHYEDIRKDLGLI